MTWRLATTAGGEAAFANLDFDAKGGTAYHVFEMDERNDPVIPEQNKADSDVLGDYRVSCEAQSGGSSEAKAGAALFAASLASLALERRRA